MSEPWFIVRAFPSDVSKPPEDEREDTIGNALAVAQHKAFDKQAHYRQVMVTDDRSMAWAVFNMLWSVYEV